MVQFLENISTTKAITGIASICGILSFILTIFILIKTSNINKILKTNETISLYNKEIKSFQKTFDGHIMSIIEDNNRSDILINNILKNIVQFDSKFSNIFSIGDRNRIFWFKRLLKKEANKVDFNKVTNYLAIISGKLVKIEGMKNV